MKRILLLCIFLAAAPGWAAEPEGAEPPAPAEALQRAYQTLQPALVQVKVQVLPERVSLFERRSGLDNLFDEFVNQRISLRLCGVRVSDTGTVLIRDPNLPLKRYGDIQMTDQEGRTVAGRLAAVLENYAAVLVEPKEKPESPLPCLQFVEPALEPGDRFYVAQPTFLEELLSVQVETAYAGVTPIQGEEQGTQVIWWRGPSYSEMSGGYIPSVTPVVLDAEGRPIGLALDNALWRSADGRDSWVGLHILADRRLSPEELADIGRRIMERSRQSVKEVQVRFREDSRLGRQLRLEEAKLVMYGLLLDDAGTVLVPTEMNRDAIQQVERIDVAEEGKVVRAEFVGLYRDLGAMLLRVKGLSGERAALEREDGIPRGRVFFTLHVRRRYGKRQDEVEHNRYLDMATGYKESRYPLPMRPLQVGDFVLDEEGRFLGFCAPQRREKQDDIRAMSRRRAGQGEVTRLYLFSEVAPMLERPEGHMDVAARPMSRKEASRMVWLGVEYQRLDAALSRALEVEGPTRDGARGLLVTHVYEDSPAQRLGIRPGDILLSLQVPGAPEEIDLAPPQRRSQTSRATGGRLWRSRRNYLTTILTLLGEGREIGMRVFAGGEERVIPITLEKAPDDFDNADEYEDQVLGLTVRQMTYEVRSVLRLSREAPGVVVSKVEPGGKAAVAQIRPYEIISRVNDEPVHSPEEFEDRVRSAAVRGRVELLVFRLGQSRIVEIDLAGGPVL